MTRFALTLSAMGLLLVFSAVSSMAETAFMSLSRLQLDRLNRARPGRLAFWQSDPDRALAVLLLWNNLTNAGLGVLAVSAAWEAARLFGVSWAWGSVLFPFGVYLLLVAFGEIAPKSLARAHAEPIALALAPALRALTAALGPIMDGVLRGADWFLERLSRLVRTERIQWDPGVIRGLLERAPMAHPLRRLLTNVVAFAHTPVSAVMTPRAEIAAVNLAVGRDRAVHRIVESGYSRVPVFRGSLDTINGMIYAKDLLAPWRSESLIVLEDIVRPLPRVPRDIPLGAVLREFRKGHHHMALVTGPGGKVVGLVTLQDALDAIVGDAAP